MCQVSTTRSLLTILAVLAVVLPAAPLSATCISCETIIANGTPTTVTIVGTFPANDCPWAKMDWEHQVEKLCSHGFCLRQDGPSPGGCSPCNSTICKWTQDVTYLCKECIEFPSFGDLEERDTSVPALDTVCASPETGESSDSVEPVETHVDP